MLTSQKRRAELGKLTWARPRSELTCSNVRLASSSRVRMVHSKKEGMGPHRPVRRDDPGSRSHGDGHGRLQGESGSAYPPEPF
jgi:hypothetical protein